MRQTVYPVDVDFQAHAVCRSCGRIFSPYYPHPIGGYEREIQELRVLPEVRCHCGGALTFRWTAAGGER